MAQAIGGADPATGNINTLWAEAMNRAQVTDQREYVPPRCFVSYETGELPVNAAVCAPTEGTLFWAQNAFYCPADNTIIFDEAWLHDFYMRRGEFAPTAILAHEWGHHIQFVLGASRNTIEYELMADCFAGMYVSWLETSELGYNDPRAAEDGLAAFFDLGNEAYKESEWFQAGEHGSRNQRMLAFMTGYLPLDNGLPWCYGYRAYDPTTNNVRLGRYDFVTLPGRKGAFSGEGYLVEPDNSTGNLLSPIGLLWAPQLAFGESGVTTDQFLATATAFMPDKVVLPQFVTDLTPNLGRGSGAYTWYESGPASAVDDFGLFGLVSPADGNGALVILVSRNGSLGSLERTPAPDELSTLAEMTVSVFQVVTRLCGPDQSGAAGDTTWNVACTHDQ